MKPVQEILVLFKTHLDLGFTDFAEEVRQRYIKEYIPNAIRVAKELSACSEGFIWTLGSWMVNEYLEHADASAVRTMEEALANGWIAWHALPFTTHTELMDEELFAYGLGISQNLDKRFGKKTIAAKMTDVPGHTRGIIKPLSEAGVEFLHIGVNPACMPPDVPPVFRWREEGGHEIIMMYQIDYGVYTRLGDTGKALYFAHTGDNLGPQSAADILKVYEDLRRDHPEATLTAATLDDVARVLRPLRDGLPVVTQEIGDSWLFGTGSDPRKMSMYRAMLRFRKTLPQAARVACNKALLPIPEHTWGLDEKTHLGDHSHFIRRDFHAAKSGEGFLKMEKSWQEQRRYVECALAAVPPERRAEAEGILADYRKAVPDLTTWEAVDQTAMFTCGDFTFAFNAQGAIAHLTHNKKPLADAGHLWGAFRYELFSLTEYERFQAQYLTNRFDWALEDLGKIGMDAAITKYKRARIALTALYRKGNRFLAVMKADAETTEQFGCPSVLEAEWAFEENAVSLDFAWRGKPANRTAEAMWLGINPVGGRALRLHKTGGMVDPLDMVKCGGTRLQGVQSGVRYDGLSIETMDTALVCPGEPSLLNFTQEPLDLSKGVFFNLYDNLYGTNFPMWYEEDARFRFVVRVG